ncbi:protection of telomeres protein 1b isoform X1 [Ziziphus jujuba]|uniref:Protection of telomeres protein 1b isoform X1 n=2 Tax=Ziziphus jujuba TaxID=326968 RepID=A0A6P3ZX37_ZIZJJ|nr:protection of telomeres protein 1b isoform X1 [Ziziphus jujuba]
MSASSSTIISIREARQKRLKKKANLAGIVTEFSFPRKSAGTDYVSILKIVDESEMHEELSVHMFSDRIEDLPLVQSYKDFIILYHVMIKEYENRPCAICNKQYSSYALFDVNSNTPNYTPYQASRGFVLLEQDTGYVPRMWQVSRYHDMGAGNSEYIVSMKNLAANQHFDLICKVLHVQEASRNRWMFFVWDGNDAPPLSLDTKYKDSEIPLGIEPVPLARHIICQFPCVGTVLRVTVDQGLKDIGLHFKGIGKWVKFRNIRCEEHSGLWHGLFLPSSRIRFLSENDDSVLQCKRTIDERETMEEGFLPTWSTPLPNLTVVDYPSLPTSTLMDFLTNSEEVAIAGRCIVRVVAICPSVREICQLVGSTEQKIRLTLEDPTARIHAHLCGRELTRFSTCCLSLDVLASKMNELLGVPANCEEEDNAARKPPWIECCLKMTSSREFFFCGTRLVVQ